MAQEEPANGLTLDVLLAGRALPQRLNARVDGAQVLLPLGELARLLERDLIVDLAHGRAHGLAQGDWPALELSVADATVRIGGRERGFEARHVSATTDDIFVSSQMLARWLPIDLQVDRRTRQLHVTPRGGIAPRPAQATGPVRQEPSTLAPVATRDLDANLLVLEMQLDGHVLSDSLNAYQHGSQILLPLGELARLLTLAITVRPDQGSASGFVLREDRDFSLSLAESVVALDGREQFFEPRLATVIGDDIYVSSQLLARWLPVDLEVVMSSLQLRVKPRARLPLQDRLARESAGARLGERFAEAGGPGYPRVTVPYQWASVPFIDQTFGSQVRLGDGDREHNARYTAYVTGDLLGMEGAAFISSQHDRPTPELRLTLGRNDPDAGLLGALHARSFAVGSINAPRVPGLIFGGPSGHGVSVSNRPLNQPTSFDRHSLRGDLPPGWDVNLYYNDALLRYQQSRGDGRYAFDDLPLAFGLNEFRLVFTGPLGQVRVERQRFMLDQSVVKPGELVYSVTQHHAENGDVRSVAQFDFGLTRAIAANVGFFRSPRLGTVEQQAYSQIGLRGYWDAMVLSAQISDARTGGSLVDLNLKSRLGGYSLDFQHLQLLDGFESDEFARGPQALRSRDRLRLSGALKPAGLQLMSLTLDVVHDTQQSGTQGLLVQARASSVVAATSVSNQLGWQSLGAASRVDGIVQLSRRVVDIGLSAQLNYSLKPQAALQSLTIAADRNLDAAYRVNATLSHGMDSKLTVLSAGLSKKLGSFGLAINGSYSNRKEIGLGVQLFVAMGRDPRAGAWSVDAQPQAGSGAVSARAFVDRNLNGIRDEDEETVANAGFILNGGGRHPSRTDASGTALINHLPPGQYADIALDPATLDDPQWRPVTPGVRVLPRPGLLQMIEFPVISTTEIDGTVYLVDQKRRRGIGDARIELVDDKGLVVAATTSSPDGYYLLHQVVPGSYTLRIAPDQAAKLGLGGKLERVIKAAADGDFISGQDFELRPKAR